MPVQVAVPPSPKALNWFCSLPESDGVFPRFFLSKETEDASFKNLYLHRTREFSGLDQQFALKLVLQKIRRGSEGLCRFFGIRNFYLV